MQRRCEQIGYSLDRATLDVVYRAAIAHADREKVVSDADLAAIVARATGAAGRSKPSAPSAVPDFQATPAEVGYGHGV